MSNPLDANAFPNSSLHRGEEGITTLQYFACAALQGLLSNSALAEVETEFLTELAVTSANDLFKALENARDK